MKRHVSVLMLGLLVVVVSILFQRSSYAINLAIRPVKVYLDAASGTEKVYLQNTSRDAFDLQVRLYAWSQDAAGKDVYEETSELVVFPKIFKVAAEEERMIRIGTRQKPGPVERCYRMYLEEIPVGPRQSEQGPSVRMLTRIGIPIFLSPTKPAGTGAIESLRLEKGRLTIALKNGANTHWPITSILVSGAASSGGAGFSKEVQGWYLLSGAARSYAVDIPADACRSLKSISVEVRSEKYSLKGGLDVDKAMCSP